MTAIAAAGANYGLKFNWKKLEVLPVRCDASIATPDGGLVKQKDSIVYLGCVLSADGTVGPELSRRLGAARAEFDTLSRVWSHAAISPRRKIQIFEACVVSKLLYGLHTAWLKSAELATSIASQARCLRKILHIPRSNHSHISKEEVLQQANRRSLRNTL